MTASITPSELKDKLTENKVCLLDVRRKADYEKSPEMIAGAIWYDPENVEEWSKILPRDQDLVVYCVKGGSVSQSVADTLRRYQIKCIGKKKPLLNDEHPTTARNFNCI